MAGRLVVDEDDLHDALRNGILTSTANPPQFLRFNAALSPYNSRSRAGCV